MKITMEHVRRVRSPLAPNKGLCVAGVRRWFDHRGLDFKDFVKHGVDESKLSTFSDDPLVKSVLREAHGQQ